MKTQQVEIFVSGNSITSESQRETTVMSSTIHASNYQTKTNAKRTIKTIIQSEAFKQLSYGERAWTQWTVTGEVHKFVWMVYELNVMTVTGVIEQQDMK